MYCKHCGKEISADSKYCQYCGGKLDVVNNEPKISNDVQKEKKSIPIYLSHKESKSEDKKSLPSTTNIKKFIRKNSFKIIYAALSIFIIGFFGFVFYSVSLTPNVRLITVHEIKGPNNIIENTVRSDDKMFLNNTLTSDIVLYNKTGKELAYVGVKYYTNEVDSTEDNTPSIRSIMPGNYICVKNTPKFFTQIGKHAFHSFKANEKSDRFIEHYILYMDDQENWYSKSPW